MPNWSKPSQRRELDDPEAVKKGRRRAATLRVNALRAVNVRDGDYHRFQLHVDGQALWALLLRPSFLTAAWHFPYDCEGSRFTRVFVTQIVKDSNRKESRPSD